MGTRQDTGAEGAQVWRGQLGLPWTVEDNLAGIKLPADIAAQSYAVATAPTEGMAKDAKLDLSGFNNVLKLRAEIEGQCGGTPPPAQKYLDLSYYEKALAGL